ncbi:hypothetical protein [Maribacter algarum]|nr:hypothetical protein [Maribacter algarum]
MEDVQSTLKDGSLVEKKTTALQKRISLRYWIGWGSTYSRSKKK